MQTQTQLGSVLFEVAVCTTVDGVGHPWMPEASSGALLGPPAGHCLFPDPRVQFSVGQRAGRESALSAFCHPEGILPNLSVFGRQSALFPPQAACSIFQY